MIVSDGARLVTVAVWLCCEGGSVIETMSPSSPAQKSEQHNDIYETQ